MLNEKKVILNRVFKGNPFADHPRLRAIWNRKWGSHVEADTISDLEKGEDDSNGNKVFLVCKNDSTVIGITGYYFLPQRCIGLRWHGIIPEYRGLGYSKQVIQQVFELARTTTNALGVVEYIEMADPKALDLIHHFTGLGFEASTTPVQHKKFPSEAALPSDSGSWLEMRADLYPSRIIGKFVY